MRHFLLDKMVIKGNKKHKMFIVVVFPFLWAFLVGNTLFELLSLSLDDKLLKIFLHLGGGKMTLLFALMHALSISISFYLVIMVVFRREDWFDRLYEFSKALKVALPFGAGIMIFIFLSKPARWNRYLRTFLYII